MTGVVFFIVLLAVSALVGIWLEKAEQQRLQNES